MHKSKSSNQHLLNRAQQMLNIANESKNLKGQAEFWGSTALKYAVQNKPEQAEYYAIVAISFANKYLKSLEN